MFYDGVANDVDELKQLGECHFYSNSWKATDFSGFEEWAKYRDVWRDA